MSRAPLPVLLFAVVWCVPAASGAWQMLFDGPLGQGPDGGTAVAADSNGDVVAVGLTQIAVSSTQLTVVKLRGDDGAPIWSEDLTGPADGRDVFFSVALDAGDDVFAAGSFANGEGVDAPTDLVVTKLRGSDGHELWTEVVDGTATVSRDFAAEVAVDANGDAIAAGAIDDVGSRNFVVLKLRGTTGEERWRTPIDLGGGFNGAFAVAVAPSGDVVAGGNGLVPLVPGPGSVQKFLVAKLAASDGAVLWAEELEGIGTPTFVNAAATVVTFDPSGDVVAGGYLTNDDDDFAVVKLRGSDGQELWRFTLDGPASGQGSILEEATTLATDAQGDVVAAGVLSDANFNQDIVVVKLRSSDGAELWRRDIVGSFTGVLILGGDFASAVAIDAAGDVLLVGSVLNDGTSNDILALKLDGADGSDLWRSEWTGSATPQSPDFGSHGVFDAAGDVLVTGSIVNAGDLGDFSVDKLRGTDGGPFFEPGLTATKTDALFDDADASGSPSVGDTLRYAVTITKTGPAELAPLIFFDDAFVSGAALVQGSVTTSRGTVVAGNGPADTAVEVAVGGLPPGADVVIAFDVELGVDGLLSNQGLVLEEAAPEPVLLLRTDDPDTAAPEDPTTTEVAPFGCVELEASAKSKISLRFDAAKPKDKWTLRLSDWVLPVGTDAAGAGVLVTLGGNAIEGPLDARGKLKTPTDKVKLRQRGNGLWKLQARRKKSTVARDLADDGLIDADVPKPGTPVMVPLRVVIDGACYARSVPMTYTAKLGKKGTAKTK